MDAVVTVANASSSPVSQVLDKLPTSVVSLILQGNGVLDILLFLGLPPGILHRMYPLVPNKYSEATVAVLHNNIQWAFCMHGVVRFFAGQFLTVKSHRAVAFVSYLLEALHFVSLVRKGMVKSYKGALLPITLTMAFILWHKEYPRTAQGKHVKRQ